MDKIPKFRISLIKYFAEKVSQSYDLSIEQTTENAEKEVDNILKKSKKSFRLFAAKNETDEIIGAALILLDHKVQFATPYYVEMFEPYRGKKMARAAWQSIEQRLKTEGFRKITFSFFCNDDTIDLISKFDYKPTSYYMQTKL